MQNESWMQPALVSGEAVLLPALERQSSIRPRFGNRYLTSPQTEDVFQPASFPWEQAPSKDYPSPARLQGSMAGRSVLRAAGVQTAPISQRCRRCR